MKFGLRFALLAQTKCQNLAPSSRLSRVTRLSSSLSSDRPSYDYTSEDCTVVFDADGRILHGRGRAHVARERRELHPRQRQPGTYAASPSVHIAPRRRCDSRGDGAPVG